MKNRRITAFALSLCFFMFALQTFAMNTETESNASTPEGRREWVMSTFLESIESRWRYHNVPSADGRLLYDLLRETKRKRALEFGSANGYSAIWIGLALEENNGRLDTVEIDKEMAKLCQQNTERAGLMSVVNCINGDALQISNSLDGNYDFFFIDLGIMEMLPFLKSIESKLAGDAIIALHNIDFERSCRSILEYAEKNGWVIEKRYPGEGGGYGFFLITK